MSSRKSKKRIGSTRQRNLGHKAEERDANEELTETITETPDEASNAGKTGVLQELSTVHHMQPLYSGEMPKCQLDVVSENIEGDQHDPGKTSTEKLETGAPAELCEAETSTSGKIRRMGSTRRTKQAFKAEERKEEEEKDNSMQIIQEEFKITRTEDQYLKEEPHAPESDQAHTHLLELGVREVKGLTERPRDESPGEEHRLLSELDVKTEAQYTHSPPQSFDQCPTPAVNPPFCVTSPQEEGESLLKQSCFNLSEAKEISSTDTTQDTPEGLDGHYQQREDQSPEDVRESDEQRRTEEVVLEGVDEQGLSKLTFTGDEESQKVKQPNPSGARSKLDLERKYGPGDTLTSLEEAVMFNIVMVGESSVGKTSFIHQFQNGQFFDDHSATIGVDTCIQTLAVDGKLVKLQIWDTAGQERFHSLTRQVLHKADGLIVMYDISSSQTFCAVRKWISCIEEGARSEVLIMLLGNKNDSEERQVLHPEGERLAQEHNFHFMECSAATGHNVPQAMEALARLLKQTVKESDEEHVTLHKKPQQKKSGCC